MGTLAVSTAPLTGAMGEIYRQAIADNIEQGFGETVSAEQAEAAVSEHLATVDSRWEMAFSNRCASPQTTSPS